MRLELTAIASSTPENCYFHFGHIPDQGSFNSLLSISDILCAAYEEFPHSSNILTKAAAFQKPVLVDEKYAMGERVRTYNLGMCVSVNDSDSWLYAIHQLVNINGEGEGAFDEFYQLHSPECLLSSFNKLLSYSFKNEI